MRTVDTHTAFFYILTTYNASDIVDRVCVSSEYYYELKSSVYKLLDGNRSTRAIITEELYLYFNRTVEQAGLSCIGDYKYYDLSEVCECMKRINKISKILTFMK